MAEIKFSQLTTAAQLTNDDIFALAQMQGGSLSSVKTSMIAVANFLNTQVQYTTAYNTQAKTTAGAINELRQLISLIPQFAIEVVEELPTEDISDTTIYLVPAEDPEVGNYYEEYIHVNNTWELVGTTAVDLSAYYTKLEVDGLLANKASVAEVALKENKSDMPTDVRTIIKDCKTPKSATITNGIAQFECIEENLVKGLKVAMNPIQSGSGDPSPTNIRPISGRTEASVTRTGKNEIDEDFLLLANGWTKSNGEYSGLNSALHSAFSGGYSGDIKFAENTQYTISFDFKSDENKATVFGFKYSDGTKSESYLTNTTYERKNFTSTINKTVVGILFSYEGNTTVHIKEFQLELGSTATAYEPYTAETRTHQYSETIYGGVDDFMNGGLSIEFGYIKLSNMPSNRWNKLSASNTYYIAKSDSLPLAKAVVAGGIYPISDKYIYQISGTMENNSMRLSDALYIRDDRFTTLADWLSYIRNTNAEICYELATPTTISTSAEEITTVSGTNIISGTEPISECKYTELATVDDLIKIIGGQ